VKSLRLIFWGIAWIDLDFFSQLDENRELVVQFMDTLTRYIQVMYFLGTISERKQLVALFAMAHQVTHVSTEPFFTRYVFCYLFAFALLC
jgi:hypothetical protein